MDTTGPRLMATSHVVIDEATQQPEIISSSLFGQSADLMAEGKIDSYSNPDAYKLEPDDLQGIVEMPFDTAAFILKYERLGLTPDESRRLCKVWCKPLQKLLGKYPKADLIIAVTVTVAIISEKSLEYYVEYNSRTGDARKRKNELSQVPPPNGESVIHS
jgi:hypothetical protein